MTENRKRFIRSISRILYLIDTDKENISKIIAGLTDLIYIVVVGMDAESIRRELGVSNKSNARKYLDKDTQNLIDTLEGLIAKDMLAAYHGKIKKAGDMLYLFIQSLINHANNYYIKNNILTDIRDPIEFYKVTNKYAHERHWKHVQELYELFKKIKKYELM